MPQCKCVLCPLQTSNMRWRSQPLFPRRKTRRKKSALCHRSVGWKSWCTALASAALPSLALGWRQTRRGFWPRWERCCSVKILLAGNWWYSAMCMHVCVHVCVLPFYPQVSSTVLSTQQSQLSLLHFKIKPLAPKAQQQAVGCPRKPWFIKVDKYKKWDLFCYGAPTIEAPSPKICLPGNHFYSLFRHR